MILNISSIDSDRAVRRLYLRKGKSFKSLRKVCIDAVRQENGNLAMALPGTVLVQGPRLLRGAGLSGSRFTVTGDIVNAKFWKTLYGKKIYRLE